MKMKHLLTIVVAAVMALAAANVNLNAQVAPNVNLPSIQLAIIGSSALYQEAGQGADQQLGCIYITGSKLFNVVDNRPSGPTQHLSGAAANSVNTTDTAAMWIAWSSAGGCSTPTLAANSIIFYANTDSVIGNRCFFGSPSCVIAPNLTCNPNAGNACQNYPCGTALPGTVCTQLPQAVYNAINNNGAAQSNGVVGTGVTAAGTDIRPEDAMFATLRAFTPCSSAVPFNTAPSSANPYVGLGLQTTNANVATTIAGATWQPNTDFTKALAGGSFKVNNFQISGNGTLAGSGDPATGLAIANGTGNGWVVQPVGGVPILVIVNPNNGSGLGSLQVTNIDRGMLSGYLDGTYGTVLDLIPQGYSSTPTFPVNVMFREPVSGTYNTMEYAIPNNVANQSSQDIGLQAVTLGNTVTGTNPEAGPYPLDYCAGAAVAYTSNSWVHPNGGVAVSGSTWLAGANTNPVQEEDTRSGLSNPATYSTRSRSIGTGAMVANVEATHDSLGYAFWSQANYSSATAQNLKYLTVDGVDPIEEVWQDGLVPTGPALENVSFEHVKDGSYPIWSYIRLVSGSGQQAAVTTLINSMANFLSPNFPDFAEIAHMSIARSHFNPPGVTYPAGAPSNGDSGSSAEAGGDVGGVAYTFQSDGQYNADNGVTSGNVGHRQ